MRWTSLLLPILGLIGFSDPAHSTLFQCRFLVPAPVPCPQLLDTSDENKRICIHIISPTLGAGCHVRPVDATTERVVCGFAHPQALEPALNEAFKLSEALRASGEPSIATASEQPGFVASSSYYASATSRYLESYYVEQAGAPWRAAGCIRQ
jgi:hypothetical protein